MDDLLDRVNGHRTQLAAAEDIEVLPLLDALVVLSLHRLGRRRRAVELARHLVAPGSSSTGAQSFPGWVRAHVLTPDEPDEPVQAHLSYGLLMARSRWTARVGALSAARSKIAGELLVAENARLSRDVHLDPLTGLANRRGFDSWLRQPPATSSLAAVVLVDVDDFKSVNDAFGHSVGDEVLRQVARLVARHVRAGDMALRLGGDEFAVVMAEELAHDADLGGPVAADLSGTWRRTDLVPACGGRRGRLGAAGPRSCRERERRRGGRCHRAARSGGMGSLYRRADDQLYRAKSHHSTLSARG